MAHILLLGLYCLLSFSNQVTAIDVDCDDPNTFDTVDEVLRFYNDAKEDGNQFNLYRTTDVKIKQENDHLTHYFVAFDIKESICPVKSGILWKECDFKEDADHGDCTGHVLVDTQLKTKEVVSHNCSLVKGRQISREPVLEPAVVIAHQPCLGCFHSIDTNSQDLPPILEAAVEKMNQQGNLPFHFGLEEVIEAARQVVSGWNYKVKYTIRQTNCSKQIYPKFNAEECTLDINGQGGNCSINAFVIPNGQINDLHLNCYLTTGFCFTCPVQVEHNDPELQTLLDQFITHYNSENNYTHLYKVNYVTKATRVLAADQKEYDVNFNIQLSNCSKSDNLILGDDCTIQPNGTSRMCEVKMNIANETVNILPNYRCYSLFSGPRITLKGFSPLRSVSHNLERFRRASHKSDRHGPNHKEDHKKEKQEKKNEKKKDKGKKKHDKKNDRSSEESMEENIKRPVVPPKHPQHESPKVLHKDVHVIVPTRKQPHSTDKVSGQPMTPSPTPLLPNLITQSSPSIPMIPAVPDLEETFTNIHDSDLLDLPVPTPETIPKCPGKLWQPLKPVLQIPTQNTFVIPGNFELIDDLVPPEAQDELPTENQPKGFNDFDLLDALDF